QELIHSDAARLALDARGLEIQVVDLGHPARAVDGDIRLEAAVLAALGGVHDEIGAERFDAADLRVDLHTDADFPGALHQQVDEIRVKAFERPGASVEDRRAHSSAGGK